MAWTAPRTWVTGEVVTAAVMNTHVRDNLNTLSAHDHDDAAGGGAANLGTLNIVGFADQAASPGTAGHMQRNGGGLEYMAGATVVSLGDSAPEAVAEMRTLGSASLSAAAGDHTHGVTLLTATGDDFASASGTFLDWNQITDGNSEFDIVTITLTDAGLLIGAAQWAAGVAPSGGNPWTLQITIDGVLTVDQDYESAVNGQESGSRDVASGARTVKGEIINDIKATGWAGLFVQAHSVEL